MVEKIHAIFMGDLVNVRHKKRIIYKQDDGRVQLLLLLRMKLEQ